MIVFHPSQNSIRLMSRGITESQPLDSYPIHHFFIISTIQPCIWGTQPSWMGWAPGRVAALWMDPTPYRTRSSDNHTWHGPPSLKPTKRLLLRLPEWNNFWETCSCRNGLACRKMERIKYNSWWVRHSQDVIQAAKGGSSHLGFLSPPGTTET